MRDLKQEEMTRLGLLGLVPFIAGAAALWLSPWLLPRHVALDFHQMTLAYGGIIVAYMAGMGAGAMLTPPPGAAADTPRSFLPGMIVTLAAFFFILPPGTFFFSAGAAWRHLVIILLLIYLLLRDLSAVRIGELPGWYGRLRMRLTFWASASLSLIVVRLFLWGYY